MYVRRRNVLVLAIVAFVAVVILIGGRGGFGGGGVSDGGGRVEDGAATPFACGSGVAASIRTLADGGERPDPIPDLTVPCTLSLVMDGPDDHVHLATPQLGENDRLTLWNNNHDVEATAARAPLFVVAVPATSAWRDYVTSEYYTLHRLLVELYGWRQFALRVNRYGGWDDLAAALVAEFGRMPDALFVMEEFALVARMEATASSSPPEGQRRQRSARELFSFRDSKGQYGGRTACTDLLHFVNDLHSFSEDVRMSRDLVFRTASAVVSMYEPVFESVTGLSYERDRVRVWYVPHAAGPLFQLPLNPHPRELVLLSGASNLPWYPYRAMVRDMIRAGDARFAELPHAGYAGADRSKSSGKVGLAFAMHLRDHLACITDGLTLNYTVAKIFEIPATGCLLLLNSEMSALVRDLGVRPWVHYAPYDAETLNRTVDFVLHPANRRLVDSIRAQGQALVWSRHTSAHRVATLHQLATASYEEKRNENCWHHPADA